MKEYKVTADRETLGHEPGESFSANIPKSQEERLIARGAIEVVGEASSDDDASDLDPPVFSDAEAPVEPEDTNESGSGVSRRLGGRKE